MKRGHRARLLVLPLVAGFLTVTACSGSTSHVPTVRAAALVTPVVAQELAPAAPPDVLHKYNGHLLDEQGFVLDGSPQADDAHCVGSWYEIQNCRYVRRGWAWPPPSTYVAPALKWTQTHAPAMGNGGAGGVAACIRQHESGGNYSTNTGNGYYGAYQYQDSTWAGYGGYQHASDAPPSVQDQKFQHDYASNPGAWPQTSKMCGA